MNRRQFLTRIPMIGAAIAAAPAVAAMAVKPEFAMGGVIAPGVPHLVGESPYVYKTLLTPDQVRAMEDAWQQSYVGIPAHDP